ncbi:hypothetical protein PLUA15_20149 [Pseudomonas lundensis]|uniref:Uncharacterized protein n=1 Tax=Pseudomonas lundensis TaxID=86185 RepID=A0AAX2H4J5_9PSED|nr:hypothetical protein PLUA15_20149 [Pseudomonas lundensis]
MHFATYKTPSTLGLFQSGGLTVILSPARETVVVGVTSHH